MACSPVFRQTQPPVSGKESIADWMFSPGRTTFEQHPSGGQKTRQSSTSSGGANDRELRVVMVDTERRCFVEFLDRGIGCACGERPVIACPKSTARRRDAEGNEDAAFEQQFRGIGGNGDGAVAARRVQVDVCRAVCFLDDAALIPATHACVTLPGGLAVRVDWKLSGGQRLFQSERSSGIDYAPRRAQFAERMPGSPLSSSTSSSTSTQSPSLKRRTSSFPDGVEHQMREIRNALDEPVHRCVVAAPLERRDARRAARMNLDAIELIFAAFVAAERRHLAGVGFARDIAGGGSGGGRPKGAVIPSPSL